jgi:hypothetical protein
VLVKLSSFKFHENPYRIFEFVMCAKLCRETGSYGEAHRCFRKPSKDQVSVTYEVQFVFQILYWFEDHGAVSVYKYETRLVWAKVTNMQSICVT